MTSPRLTSKVRRTIYPPSFIPTGKTQPREPHPATIRSEARPRQDLAGELRPVHGGRRRELLLPPALPPPRRPLRQDRGHVPALEGGHASAAPGAPANCACPGTVPRNRPTPQNRPPPHTRPSHQHRTPDPRPPHRRAPRLSHRTRLPRRARRPRTSHRPPSQAPNPPKPPGFRNTNARHFYYDIKTKIHPPETPFATTENQMEKVFLLLFFQKKKTLPFPLFP